MTQQTTTQPRPFDQGVPTDGLRSMWLAARAHHDWARVSRIQLEDVMAQQGLDEDDVYDDMAWVRGCEAGAVLSWSEFLDASGQDPATAHPFDEDVASEHLELWLTARAEHDDALRTRLALDALREAADAGDQDAADEIGEVAHALSNERRVASRAWKAYTTARDAVAA